MIKELITDEEFLQKPSEPATIEDAQIAQDLIDTMKSMSDTCACLAANQSGELKAVTAYAPGGKIYTMFNPVIKQAIVPYTTEEGCLSLGYDTVTKRFKRIIVEFNAIENGEWVARKRKLTDWNAQIVQHAIDHCNGILV